MALQCEFVMGKYSWYAHMTTQTDRLQMNWGRSPSSGQLQIKYPLRQQGLVWLGVIAVAV